MPNSLIVPISAALYFDREAPFSTRISPLSTAVRLSYDNIGALTLTSYVTGASAIERFRVEGTQGSLFSVTDVLTGVLFSVNDISGLPILTVQDTDTVIAGAFNTNTVVVSGSRIAVGRTVDNTVKLAISGNTTIIGTLSTSGTVAASGFLVKNKQAVNGPAFYAYPDSGAAAQTITSGSQQKVTFGLELFDTDNCFASSRFTPTVEGYYQLNSTVRLDGSSGTGELMIVIWKNGAEYSRGWNSSGVQIGSSFWSMSVSTIAYANGTSDYFEVYVQQTDGVSKTVQNGASYITYFNGSMIRGA